MHGGDGKAAVDLLERHVRRGVHLLGGEPASPRISDSAMVKQPAWAAPISSSGLVPGLPSKRAAKP